MNAAGERTDAAPATTYTGAGPGASSLDLRRALGRFSTGVAVVTCALDGKAHGMTVNSFTSVSVDPPMVLVCLMSGARTARVIDQSREFAISVLSTRQEELGKRFARQGEEHFAGLSLEYGNHAVPVIPGALAHVECSVDRIVTAGDHVVVLGLVRQLCDRDGEPLVFYGGRFGDFAKHGEDAPLWFF